MNNKEWQILPMQAEDLETVIQIGLTTPEFQTGTDAAQFYSPETMKRWITDLNGVTLVAKVDKALAGFLLGAYMQGPNDAYFNCLVVLPEYQGQGIGSALLQTALDKFQKMGCDHVFGVVKDDNANTIKMMKKNRFQIGEVFRYVETMLPQR